jgi:flagellar protein FliS
MTDTRANEYLRTKVMTSSPAELRLMLFDGAVRFLEQGRQGLEDKDYEAAYNGISRTQAIIMELMNGLRDEHDPDLCEKLRALYTFMYTQLVAATTDKDVAKADEVLDLLYYERETWKMLLQRLTDQQIEAKPDADEETAEQAPERADRGSFSAQG